MKKSEQIAEVIESLDPEVLAEISRKRNLPLDEKKKLAKELYSQYAGITWIADNLDINISTLKCWIYGLNSAKARKQGGWKTERELSKNATLRELTSNKRGMISHMVNGAIYLLYDYVEKTKIETIKTGKCVSIKDAEKLTGILSNLDRIIQNAKNDEVEDDGTFEKPSSIEEIKQRISVADPFTEDIETTAKEMTNDEPGKKSLHDNCDDDIIIDDSDL